jgi:hypothetical protein
MINSTRALIIYLAAMIVGLGASKWGIHDAVVIAYFTNINTAFIAYIYRRYKKYQLEQNGK